MLTRVNVGLSRPQPLPSRAAALILSAGSAPGRQLSELAGASALLVGTAIGGGFLALPYATAPSGALPSALVLVACWAWLLCEALLISDMVIDASGNSTQPISFASLSRDAFGDAGSFAVSSTFVLLMMTTMVSQLSKGAELLLGTLPGMSGASCAMLLAISVAAFAQGASVQVLSLVNGALTAGFVAATGSIFADGVPQAVWSRLGRADWTCAFASAPTLLQLHVYCEIVPLIVEALGRNRRRVRVAIVGGSLVLLALQLSWSCLGIALVAPTAAGSLRMDPVSVLLDGGVGARVAAATAATAATAILTTLLGTLRALHSFCVDAASSQAMQAGGRAGSDAAVAGALIANTSSDAEVADTTIANGGPPWLRRAWKVAYGAMALVPAVIASTATATDAFFGAIDLAGAYPVALLWGLVPPLMAMRLRAKAGSTCSTLNRLWTRTALLGLAALSTAFVGSNLYGDLGWLLDQGANARWR